MIIIVYFLQAKDLNFVKRKFYYCINTNFLVVKRKGIYKYLYKLYHLFMMCCDY